ncbi:MAG TPA: AAA family ATPase, partial [Ktedonobacteraceae bacterium]|nr:AAA family ATPase [Ktedonobacteraceae bacterium]
MNPSMSLGNQLLATKFYVPVASGTLISRPRLTALLDESLKCPFTLVSAPAGFGKTTLLSAWKQALPASKPRVAWVSLDQEDNDPRLFWTYVLTALKMQQPNRFSLLLTQLQSPEAPSLSYVLATLINLLVEGTDHFLLILDDYQMIIRQEVHTTLAYLIEHLPAQLRIILATRADPPLPLPLLRAREQALEVRTDQLRCTVEETRAFLYEVMNIQLPDKTIQQIKSRTEGWMVGLQLLGLSLQGHDNPATVLEEISGDQRYILDYLTQEILQRQPQDVQLFLLSTSILEQFNASLCDAIMQQHGSQQMLERLEQANLFVVFLDSKRQWYRYHALFAEALRYQLEQTQGDLIRTLHHRASLWYAQHDQITQAILHAFRAKEWQWAADLIERKNSQITSLTWRMGEYELHVLQQWLEQLPAEILHSRPRLCLACIQFLWDVAPHIKLLTWIDMSQAALTALLKTQISEDASRIGPISQRRQEQENLLGEVIAWRALLLNLQDGHTALTLCQQALSLLSGENTLAHFHIHYVQLLIFYTSAVNNAVIAIEEGLRSGMFAHKAGVTHLAIGQLGSTAPLMIGAGQLDATVRLAEQTIQMGTNSQGLVLPDVGFPMFFKAEILREHNNLHAAHSLVEEGISLCHQIEAVTSPVYLVFGYA